MGAGTFQDTRAGRTGFSSRATFSDRAAFRNRGVVHDRFAFRDRDRFAFRHHGFRHRFFASAGSCFVVRHVRTPWGGWRWRRIWVC
jgi:hypothetical protein